MSQWSNMNLLFTIIPVGMVLLFTGIFGGFFYGSIVNRSIQKKGVATNATLLSARETGTRINNQPEIECSLSYKVNGQEYVSTTREVIGALDLHKLSVGSELVIKYLPENPEKIVLSRG
ncbi:DUF3592 domain-containing protein [Peptostreptococcus faecalis]|uniref:DUF3592 domain-containing protein n=1 Tax=Peptostreptococcus faecalis TaxID=2045015 RepID=UPI0011AFB63D|nr:DUF3592 domain-containing protein [Peptostreptococcus faecalis]